MLCLDQSQPLPVLLKQPKCVAVLHRRMESTAKEKRGSFGGLKPIINWTPGKPIVRLQVKVTTNLSGEVSQILLDLTVDHAKAVEYIYSVWIRESTSFLRFYAFIKLASGSGDQTFWNIKLTSPRRLIP